MYSEEVGFVTFRQSRPIVLGCWSFSIIYWTETKVVECWNAISIDCQLWLLFAWKVVDLLFHPDFTNDNYYTYSIRIVGWNDVASSNRVKKSKLQFLVLVITFFPLNKMLYIHIFASIPAPPFHKHKVDIGNLCKMVRQPKCLYTFIVKFGWINISSFFQFSTFFFGPLFENTSQRHFQNEIFRHYVKSFSEILNSPLRWKEINC